MTDGIGRLSGYGNCGVGGYIPQRRNGDVQKEFGEELAPTVMDVVMDRLMGMTE